MASNIDLFVPIVVGTLLMGTLFAFIGYFVYIHYKTRQKFDWERQRHKQALLQTEIEIREQTLDHISRELHDNLGQIASLIKIKLNLIFKRNDGKDKDEIEESIELVKRMIGDIKSLSLSLNSDNISRIGLLEALKNDVLRINKIDNITVELKSESSIFNISPDVEVFLYRMSQEILNNTLKHAMATEAKITLTSNDDKLLLVIADNGIGFDTQIVSDHSKTKTNSGLNNLKKRCKIIGAEIYIESTPGSGTSIYITLPLNSHSNGKK